MFDPINPLGTDGFEFVEYTAADANGITQLKELFKSLGFSEVAQHRSKQAWLYKQGDNRATSTRNLQRSKSYIVSNLYVYVHCQI